MANKLDQIIDISISLSTKGISQQGFGTPLIIGEAMKLNQRVKQYGTLEEVLDDFAEGDAEYKEALAAFSQDNSPTVIKIGKKVVAGSTAITAATNPTGNVVNIQKANHNLQVGASVVVSGFATSGYNGTFTVTQIVDANNFRYTAGGALAATPATGSGSYTASETWSNAIQMCENYDSDWYGLIITSNAEADILASAAKIEALKKLFICRSSDADNLDSADTGSVLYQLHALNYDRTALMYNGDTSTKFIDGAWAGRMLPTIPGSENWAFKELAGVAADNLSTSQSAGVFANKGNTYEVFAGRSVTREGFVVSGEYIDTIRGADWLKARLQESIFLLLINSEKVPYTDAGGDMVENAMREVFEQAVANGFIAKDGDGKGLYNINVPSVASIPLNDRLTRYLSGITFDATLAGAVNKIGIAGNLTV